MSDKKITQLTNITGANLVDAGEFVVVDISADETKAITLGELKTAFDSVTGFVRITGDTMTGDLTVPNVIVSGNVDGRDVSADGTKLDGIATGATAYSNADVDSHVNVSTATASQVLSWTGSDYDWITPSSGDLLAANNLSDLDNVATARTNLDVDQAGTALAFAIALG
jgi:hypothetical protein